MTKKADLNKTTPKKASKRAPLASKIPLEVLYKLRKLPIEEVRADLRSKVFTTQQLKAWEKSNAQILKDPIVGAFSNFGTNLISPKQLMSYRESTARINIWDGAVRSGKTVASILRFLKYVRNGPPGELIVVGRTHLTIKRNILYTIQNVIGLPVKMSAQNSEMNIFNRRIHVVGANDERAEGKIRGMTAAGAYVDEATLIPEGFFKMLLSRLSIPKAQLFATTNPDSPYHYLKRDIIDKEGMDLKHFHFHLEDNTTLSKEYIDALKHEYSGLWYKRYIEGEWCVAEGAIYDFFDEKIHVIDVPPGSATYYIVGIDYGTHNCTGFTMIGHNPLTYPNTWVEKEYYWDSVKRLRQKTDSDYADDLVEFLKGYPVKMIYVDPSALSFKVECRRRDIGPMKEAENDVLDGIRFVSKMMLNGTLKICRSCRNLIQEMQTYSWDERSRDIGVDKPKKANDHLCDSLRYAIFTHFYKKSKHPSDAMERELEFEDPFEKHGFGRY